MENKQTELNNAKIFRLGSWIVEPASGTLRQEDEIVHLAPKVMDLLLLLVSRQGEVVTKDELISSVWPDTFVAETALTRSISELRHSLNDSTGTPVYIETIPKRGYRFLIPAEEFVTPRNFKAWTIPVSVVAVLLLVSAVVLFLIGNPWGGDTSSGSPQRVRNLVVLPFTGIASEQDSDVMTIGAAEIIIEYLSRIDSLNVASGTSLTHFEHNTKDLREIAQHLGVPYLMEGSFRHTDLGTGILVRLSDTRTREVLWSGEFNLRDDNIEFVAAEISREVASFMGVELDAAEVAASAGRPSDNFEALQYRLMADYFRNKVPDSLEMAVEYYQMAIEKRPSYAPAFAGLAITYMGLDSWGENQVWAMKAQEALSRAMALNPEIPESHIANGVYLRIYRKDFLAAELALKEAIRLDPFHSNARREYGLLLMRDLGRPDEALFQLTEATRLDPLLERNYIHLFELYCIRGEYLKAVEIARRQHELNPVNPLAYRNIAQAYLLLGDRDEAIKWAKRCIHLYEFSSKSLYFERGFQLLASLYLDQGEFDMAADVGDQLNVLSPGDETVLTIRGFSALYRRDFEKAAGFFRDFLELKPTDIVWPTGIRISTYLAYALQALGDREGAAQALNQSTQVNRESNASAYEPNIWPPFIFQDQLAVHALRGERDEALKYLDDLIENGWKAYALIEKNPVFEELLMDPALQTMCEPVRILVDEMRLQDEVQRMSLR